MDFRLSPSTLAWQRLCCTVEKSAILNSEMRLRCMENTRIALLESVRQVLDHHYQMNIWLNGHDGIGKTSIVFTVAEEMKRAGRLAATFFFLPRHAQSVPRIIPTIAYQLALTFPSIRDDIVKAIENEGNLLWADKSCDKQIQELVIKPLRKLSCEAPYAIVIDGPDECLSAKEAARLLALLTEALSGPDLPIIHLVFTSRPEAHIRTAVQAGVHEISLTTRDDDTVQDVRFFLQASLDRIRTSQPTIFGQPPKSWPSEDEIETLAFKAGGLFVYAAMAINFISTTGRDPQQRLDILLREQSTVGADIDQLYRQIIATSENPLVYCRLLASIIRFDFPEPLVALQQLFHEDKEILAAMLGSFSPVILNPPDNFENVEIYHASLRDFIVDPLRSKDYYVDDAHAHEHLACCCLALLNIQGGRGSDYAFTAWGNHLSKAYPSNKLRHLLKLLSKGTFLESDHGLLQHMLQSHLHRARETCLSLKWIRSHSDMAVAWRLVKASRRVDEAARKRAEGAARRTARDAANRMARDAARKKADKTQICQTDRPSADMKVGDTVHFICSSRELSSTPICKALGRKPLLPSVTSTR